MLPSTSQLLETDYKRHMGAFLIVKGAIKRGTKTQNY